MLIYRHQYHDIVRVEVQSKESNERQSISFAKTTLQEVIEHVTERCKPCLVIDGGVKVKVLIRISHPEKKWGDQRSFTFRVTSVTDIIRCLSEGIEEY